MAAGERLDEAGGVVLAMQGEGRELQADNPAFGARFQSGDVCHRETETHHLIEELGGFGRAKAQVRGA